MSFANPAYSRLSVEDEERIERIIEAYLRSKGDQESGTPSSIEDILPDEPNLRTAVLIELIHADIERRICTCDELCFPEYLQRFPELQNDQVACSGIVRTEWQLRSERGQTFSIEQLLRTFQSATVVNSSASKQNSPFHRYRLLRYLGEGAFGIVFLCEDVVLDRQVAVKLPHPSLCHVVDRERFLNEARLSSDLRHPNIVRLLEFVEWGNWTLLITEYVDGIDLSSRLKSGPLLPEVACQIAVQIAHALAYAHDRGLIHGDLKPANILVDRNGNAFLADFGLTVEAISESSMQFKGGTPAYLARELASGQIAAGSVSSDVFALGVVLFEMLTGRLPDHQQYKSTRQNEHSHRDTNTTIADDRWNSLIRICDRAMEKNPSDRFRTANDFALVLETWLAASSPTGLPAEIKRSPMSALDYRLTPHEDRLGKGIIAVSLLTLLCLVARLGIDEPVAGRTSVADVRTSSLLLTRSTVEVPTDVLESAAQLSNCFRELATDPDNQRARDLLRDATEIYDRLLQETDPSPDFSGNIALIERLLNIADHQRTLCLYEEANRSLERVSQILLEQMRIDSIHQGKSSSLSSEMLIRLQITSQFQRLAVHIESGNLTDAAALRDDLQETLRGLKPHNVQKLRSLFPDRRIDFYSALLYEANGDAIEAGRLYEKSLPDLERWYAETKSYDSGWYLNMLRYRLARILKRSEDGAEVAITLFKKAAEGFRASVVPQRGDPGFFMAHCRLNASELCLRSNRPDESMNHARQCLVLFDSTYAKRKSSPTGMRLLAKASFFCGSAAVRMNDFPTAAKEFEEAIQCYSACLDLVGNEKSTDLALVRDLAASHHGLANCLEELSQLESSALSFCEAARYRLSLCSNNTDNPEYVSDLLGTLARIVELSHRFPSKPQAVAQLANRVENDLEEWADPELREKLMNLLKLLRDDRSVDLPD